MVELWLAQSPALADPLCTHRVAWEDTVYGRGVFRMEDFFRLEVEVEGPVVGCAALTRVVTAFWGRIDTGYVWIDDLCTEPKGSTTFRAGSRFVVLLQPTSPVAGVRRWDAFDGLELAIDRPDAAWVGQAMVYRAPGESPGFPAAGARLRTWLGCGLWRASYACYPWYGNDREYLRAQAAEAVARGEVEPHIAGAPSRDGVPAPVDHVPDSLLPDWSTLELLYDDVVRVTLTHGETEGTGRDGCRAFGTVFWPVRGPRHPGEPVVLDVPPPWCSFANDLERPVTWLAVLAPTDDPRADARVVELLPLEPLAAWAGTASRTPDPVFRREQPDCYVPAHPPDDGPLPCGTCTCLP